MANRILRIKEVEHKTGLCRTSIYSGSANGTFPKQFKLSQRSIGWLEADIDDWIEQRIVNRDKKGVTSC